MPIKMGDKTYDKFEDASKAVQSSKGLSKDRANAYVASIDRKQNEAKALEHFKKAVSLVTEQDAQEPQGLTTPDAGDQDEGAHKDLTSAQGSSREAENPNVSGGDKHGELSKVDPPQDQAQDPANPQDQAEPPQIVETETPESESEYGTLDKEEYTGKEQTQNEDKRDDQQGLEYNGETYHKVKAIEYEDEIYVQKDDKEEAKEEDLEYEDDIYRKANEEDLEYDDDIYVKDNEQAPMDADVADSTPTTAHDIPELNPIGESVIIKENGKFRKYNVFQAREQDEDSVTAPAEVKDSPPVEAPQGDQAEKTEEPEVEPVEQKASEEIKAVEKIIVKEGDKLKFKSVFTEVKKKL